MFDTVFVLIGSSVRVMAPQWPSSSVTLTCQWPFGDVTRGLDFLAADCSLAQIVGSVTAAHGYPCVFSLAGC